LSGAGGFDGPAVVSSDGTHVWVASKDNNINNPAAYEFGNSVTELNAATGALAKVITGSSG
jgi:hypothetical protein